MESAVHPGFRLDEETGRNLVEGNRDEVEHVEYVFEHVLKGAGGGRARIDVIGSEWTGAAAVRYLGRHCKFYFLSPSHNVVMYGVSC